MKYISLALIGACLATFALGCHMPKTSRETLKEEIMLEVLAENAGLMIELRQLLAEQKVTGEKFVDAREQMTREITAEVVRKFQMLEPDSDIAKVLNLSPYGLRQVNAGPTGVAEGEILHRGKGLPDCRVKLVRLVQAESIAGLLKVFKEETEFETVTDEHGKYRFEMLPVGSYKLKWQLPGDTGWIRRLKDRPDVTVSVGQTSVIKTVETTRGLVPS
ncbi:MAG: carboxypeptidase-like regulatory domain-containing protein [Planctomycetia bacterium]|nr:carboxypeptidase-like regulatory domain-containing protein [Planctomycetia bacterium]